MKEDLGGRKVFLNQLNFGIKNATLATLTVTALSTAPPLLRRFIK